MNLHISFTLRAATFLLSIFGVFAAQTSRETSQASSHALTDFASSHQSIAPTVTWHHTVLCIALTCCLASYNHAHSLSNNLTCSFSCYAPSSCLKRPGKKRNQSYLTRMLMRLKAKAIGCCFTAISYYTFFALNAWDNRISPHLSSAKLCCAVPDIILTIKVHNNPC
jgi:hypothetical protein